MVDYIYQSVYSNPSFPTVTWRQDTLLAQPELLGPRNEANLCFDTTFVAASGTGINLLWTAVSGATFYVVQLCNNSSFSGPTLRSIKVTAAVTLEMLYDTHILLGEEIYWRVSAYDGVGGTSPTSKVFQFTYDCPEITGNLENKNQQPSPDGGGGAECGKYNVSMQVKGPPIVDCCGIGMWILSVSWTCIDDDGNAISLTSVAWTLKQSSRSNVSFVGSSTGPDKVILKVRPSSGNDISEQFSLKAEITFTIGGGGGTFTCSDEKDVTVDCDIALQDKLKVDYAPDHYGLITYMHEDYVEATTVDHFFFDEYYTLTTDGTPLGPGADPGAFDHKYALALGPVLERQEILAYPADSDDPCESGIGRGQDTRTVHEAQVNIPLGCGLYVDGTDAVGTGNVIGLYLDDIVGPGLYKSGLREGSDCEIGVSAGCGLYIDDLERDVRLDICNLAGDGLCVESTEFCEMYVNTIYQNVVIDVYCYGGVLYKTTESYYFVDLEDNCPCP